MSALVHPARLLLEAGKAAYDQTQRAALRLALAETQGDIKAAAALLGMGYSTTTSLLAATPEVRAWLDENYPDRKGARRTADGAPRVSSRR